MTQKRDLHDTCHMPPACERCCTDIPRELPHYFTGRVLTARDLRDEQDFVLSRLRLRNRLFHGTGVVCGLDVCEHPDPACRDRYVVVHPGIAIDCCGTEIFVCEPCVVELPPPPPRDDCPPDEGKDQSPGQTPYPQDEARPRDPRQQDDQDPGQQPPDRPDPRDPGGERPYEPRDDDKDPDKPRDRTPRPDPEWGPFIVCLHGMRKGIEPRPVLDDPCGCDGARTAPTRIRHGHHVHIVPHDDLDPDCWPMTGDAWDPGCGCRRPEARDCFKPDCPRGNCLPLALLTWTGDGVQIDMAGRPDVITTQRRHTRIAWINWTHGATLPASDIRDRLNGVFEVGFTAPLAATDADAGTGISRFTFEITYGGVQSDVEFLESEEEPYLSDDGCIARFPVSKRELTKIERYAFNDFRIRLRGDLILDFDGRPIDANFLRARLPSGNGTAGGTFESWFSTRN